MTERGKLREGDREEETERERERQRAREGKADGVYGEITAGKGRMSVRVRERKMDTGKQLGSEKWRTIEKEIEREKEDRDRREND